jgi:hypothetical protein
MKTALRLTLQTLLGAVLAFGLIVVGAVKCLWWQTDAVPQRTLTPA